MLAHPPAKLHSNDFTGGGYRSSCAGADPAKQELILQPNLNLNTIHEISARGGIKSKSRPYLNHKIILIGMELTGVQSIFIFDVVYAATSCNGVLSDQRSAKDDFLREKLVAPPKQDFFASL